MSKHSRVLYIGQFCKGSTSKMRAEAIDRILRPSTFNVIDTSIPIKFTHRIFRSLGFRFLKGPLIRNVNKFIITNLSQATHCNGYDLIWVDKAVFITSNTSHLLREYSRKLIHYTPDMAFEFNRSYLFESSIHFYDLLITTKSPELQEYLRYVDVKKLMFVTQGFSKKIHRPLVDSSKKEECIAFVGLAEPSRMRIIELLIEAKIKVKVAGKGWSQFVKKNKNNPFLKFETDSLADNDYSLFISSAAIAWGALSKKFNEQHTTRTFEIPACGSVLLTEYNHEIASYFNEDEVIFYRSESELLQKVRHFLKHPRILEKISMKGFERVHSDARDYESIISGILNQIK